MADANLAYIASGFGAGLVTIGAGYGIGRIAAAAMVARCGFGDATRTARTPATSAGITVMSRVEGNGYCPPGT